MLRVLFCGIRLRVIQRFRTGAIVALNCGIVSSGIGGSTMATLLRAPKCVVRTPVADSLRWNQFEPRDGDIVIATFAKCGTTWTQRIVDLLVFQSPDVRPFGEISPWLDSTIFNPLAQDLDTLEAQTHRRYIK